MDCTPAKIQYGLCSTTSSNLPYTGINLGWFIAAAVVLLVIGGLFLYDKRYYEKKESDSK